MLTKVSQSFSFSDSSQEVRSHVKGGTTGYLLAIFVERCGQVLSSPFASSTWFNIVFPFLSPTIKWGCGTLAWHPLLIGTPVIW